MRAAVLRIHTYEILYIGRQKDKIFASLIPKNHLPKVFGCPKVDVWHISCHLYSEFLTTVGNEDKAL